MSVHLSSLAIIYKEKLRRPFLRQFLRFLRRLPRMLFKKPDHVFGLRHRLGAAEEIVRL